MELSDKLVPELTAKCDQLIKLAGTQAGTEHGAGLLAHLVELKDAIVARDVYRIAVAIRDLMTHFIGDEMFASAEEMQAFPWGSLLPIFLAFIKKLLENL